MGLDSLGRVEFLAALEAELDGYGDESQVAEHATVAGEGSSQGGTRPIVQSPSVEKRHG